MARLHVVNKVGVNRLACLSRREIGERKMLGDKYFLTGPTPASFCLTFGLFNQIIPLHWYNKLKCKMSI